MIESELSYPIVLKKASGSQGKGVMKIDSHEQVCLTFNSHFLHVDLKRVCVCVVVRHCGHVGREDASDLPRVRG